jgi:hypothetical protein
MSFPKRSDGNLRVQRHDETVPVYYARSFGILRRFAPQDDKGSSGDDMTLNNIS